MFRIIVIRTISMLFLPMVILRVFVIHAIRELVFGMGPVVVMKVPVFVLPGDLFVMAHHWPREVMEGMSVTTTSSVSVFTASIFVVYKSISFLRSKIVRSF